MDKEKLISAVFVRDPIWDKKNKYHHNSLNLAKLWKEVAEECEGTIPAVKGQWKRLRETFVKKFAAIPPKRSGQEASDDEEKSDWPFFESLLFLKDQCTPRETSGNFSTNEVVQLSAEENDDGDEEDANQFDSVSQISTSSCSRDLSPALSTTVSAASLPNQSRPTRKRVTKKTDLIGDALLKAEREKIEYLKRKEENRKHREERDQSNADEDVSFFNSILPHVKTLNPSKKMKFRIKVLQLLDEDISNTNTTVPVPASASSSIMYYERPHNSSYYEPSNLYQSNSNFQAGNLQPLPAQQAVNHQQPSNNQQFPFSSQLRDEQSYSK